MNSERGSLLEADNGQDSYAVAREQTRILYMQAPVSNITVIVIATLFYGILSSRVESSLIGYWTVALYITALFRLLLWYRHYKTPEWLSNSAWMNLYIFACALVGVSWSMIYPLIYIANDEIISFALFILVFGVISSAVAILNISMRAFIVYTYPQALILGLTLLQSQDTAYKWLTISLVIYLLMTTLFTRNANRSTLRSIRLQVENRALIDQLNLEIGHREELIEQRTIQLKDKNQELVNEVRERKQAEIFQARQKSILERISRGTAPLSSILEEIVLLAEGQTEGLKGAILLLEGDILHIGSAPNLPGAYSALIDGMVIGSAMGSCCTAAYKGERVIVDDAQSDPLCANFRDLLKECKFGACWSEPILDSEKNILGNLTLYHHSPTTPGKHEILVIETMSQIASIAIERSRTVEKLRQSATIFQSTLEGVMITDTNNDIVEVNNAFESITGYMRDDVIGRNPRFLQSGRHEKEFYDELWNSLKNLGQWRGEIWNRRNSGEIYPEWLNISSISDRSGHILNYIGVFSDITSIKRSEEELDHLAHHDPLTDLPNRLLFNSQLEHTIKHAHRNNSVFAVLFLDLDRFKNINDSLGHKAGDNLLQQLAVRLKEAVRLDDTVARISGDEFVILLEDIGTAENTAHTVEKIISTFNTPFLLDDHETHITSSVGISLYPANGDNVAELLRNADTAMYRAKDEGRNTYQFYNQEMTSIAFERVVMENALRAALNHNEFRLLYQPQIDMVSGKLIGVEALIRWDHPEIGEILPGKFIPLAEENGLIHDIGAWVMETACQQGQHWLEEGFDFGRISVNIAHSQLQQSNFVDNTKATLKRTQLPAGRLEIEVTESVIMQNAEHAIQRLKTLRILGLRISLDDFGTGYSSMSYLKLLPIDKLKIDLSFIRNIPHDTNDMAITEAVIALGKALDLQVIAEGVETEQQAAFLKGKGCRQAQGFLYSRPIGENELKKKYSSESS
ncbi:MAG: EAL domain-containing protein [Candidatus Sedimenticola sp. (ex Thyasira tokunagai)]